ncbi:hypothetical protein OUZ56_017011 [Daphnia magna]|uniref:Uncharacterized protein n=1 Tax=Daphnia magna TaxID=35525 RepID=A0ABR0ARW9_9CRUS|nr:hypothetical protein OUZ56_017011 [Daphnia magna]
MTELTHYLTLAIRLHKHCTVKSYQKHAFTRTKVFAPYAGSRFSLSLAFTVRKSATCGLLKYNNSFSGIKLLVEIDGRQTRISDKPNYSYPIFRRGNEQQLDNFNKDRCMYRFILPRTLGHMGQQFPTNKAGAVFEFSITNERVTLGISNIVRNGCFFFGTVASIYCNNMFGYVGFLRKY